MPLLQASPQWKNQCGCGVAVNDTTRTVCPVLKRSNLLVTGEVVVRFITRTPYSISSIPVLDLYTQTWILHLDTFF